MPARDPVKFCLQAMDVLFTKEELDTKRFKVTRKRGDREPLPTLDEAKVKLNVIVQNRLINTCIYFFRCHYSTLWLGRVQ